MKRIFNSDVQATYKEARQGDIFKLIINDFIDEGYLLFFIEEDKV